MKLDIIFTIRSEPIDLCPPHDFQCAWATPGENTNGVVFCSACGTTLSLDIPAIGAPIEERVDHERR